ncbi:MAG: type II and III secretion system protein, partial [Bdellovibrionales bacterium]|nr:type II and III secretion system protein [Bdellovibrionales bacterium]
GELLSLQDWLKIYNVQRNYSSFCSFQAKIHPLIRQNVYDFWKQKIHHEQLQELKLNLETYFEISSYQLNEKDYERLNKKIAPWGLTIHQRENIKQRPALVQVKLLLAEVSKNHNQNYGFDWSQNYQANLLPGKDILGSWLVKLNALESAGEGQVLAAPTLVAESGGQAEFLAGGEFPIRVKAFSSSKVEWKKHGLLFKIYPVVDASSRVFLKIESEVSMIDSANSVEGIPGLKVSRLNSQFNLKNGETVALSGLIQQRMAEGNSGISFIKNIPVLGALFKSQNFQNEKSELVVFVQPLVVEQNQNVDFPQYELLNEHYRTY